VAGIHYVILFISKYILTGELKVKVKKVKFTFQKVSSGIALLFLNIGAM